jgi:LacI family transcriptional regulator
VATGGKRPKLSDVARAAGVSAAAVSYALSGEPGVGPDVRARILTIAKELGYQPSRMARGLRTGRSRTIGLLLADITNPFYTDMAVGAVEAAEAAGYEVVVSHVGLGPERLTAAALTHIGGLTDGLLLTSLRSDDEAVVEELRQAGIPLIQLYRRVAGAPIDWVGIDDEQGGYDIAAHVLSTGRTKVAILGGLAGYSASAARVTGFRQALATSGLHAINEPDVHGGIDMDVASARAMDLLLAYPDVEAVLCGGDLIALSVLVACQQLGRSVPGDVAITGFNGELFATIGPMRISTVSVPRQLIGAVGVQLLLRRVDGDDSPPVDQTLPYLLRPGDTS